MTIGWVCVAGIGLGADAAGAASPAGGVQVVVSAGCFGVERVEEARLGAKLLARHIWGELKRPVSVRLAQTTDEIRVAMAGSGDVVMMSGDDWALRGREGGGLVAVAQSRAGEATSGSWVLVARANMDEVSVSRGTVVVAGWADGQLPEMWLELWRRSRALTEGRVGTPELTRRESSAALGVLRTYFGKSDACVVPEMVFIDVCAQNPAVGQRLKRLAISPPMPGAVVAVKTSDGTTGATSLRLAMERLGSTPHGAALAALLGDRGFGPFADDRWKSVAALVASHQPSGRPRPGAVATGPSPQPSLPASR